MASMWRRTMVYLGLVDEPEDAEDGLAAPSRVVETSPNVRPLQRDEPSTAPAPSRPTVIRTMPTPSTAARVHVTEPRGFNDAQEVGDRLKANQPVILNLQGLDRDLQRRLID